MSTAAADNRYTQLEGCPEFVLDIPSYECTNVVFDIFVMGLVLCALLTGKLSDLNPFATGSLLYLDELHHCGSKRHNNTASYTDNALAIDISI